MGDVREQRLSPLALIDRRADMAVEIAIGTFADAEWPVNVERERLAAQSFSAPSNLRNASARWLIWCLRSGSSSPNVWS